MLSLRELQVRFFQAIAGEPGKSGGFDPLLVEAVRMHGSLSREERIGVYVRMYFARLLDALQEDFPRVAAYLGWERFQALVRAYVQAHPSTHPSVRHIGRRFADFLAAQPEIQGELPFLPDLARLEWGRLEVFDAPDAEPVQLEQLRRLPPEDWPTVRFQVIPACRVLHSAWPVHEIWAGGEGALRPERIKPRETVVRIWRQGFVVYQASMDRFERRAWAYVQEGEPFAALCAALAPSCPPEAVVQEVSSLLLRWIEDGLLVLRTSEALLTG
ncbi:MAG: DNA-binding domain-containing protein [Candidatus Binatia bacterium]|nr:DNA-binding domain-containing protein [Candidatus Binatia bacterium]